MSEDIEVVAYVGCESRMTMEGWENGDEYLVFADTSSAADKRYSVPLMTVAQCQRLLAAKDAELEQYKRDAERMRVALEEIISPIKFMQARLDDGYELNGLAAIQMANDPQYLQQIAKQAIAALNQQQAEVDL